MSNETMNGRDPDTGRALRKDGKPRRKRRTLSPTERILQLQEQQRTARANIGRTVLKGLVSLSDFMSGIGTFRRWLRDARSYATPEKREARSAYFQRMLDTVEAKGEAAVIWLPGAEQAEGVIGTLFEAIGTDIEAYLMEHGVEPDSDTVEGIVRKYLTDEILTVVESANDPENDPFAVYRRGADSDDEDSDDDSLE
jgi:hypothetical protein